MNLDDFIKDRAKKIVQAEERQAVARLRQREDDFFRKLDTLEKAFERAEKSLHKSVMDTEKKIEKLERKLAQIRVENESNKGFDAQMGEVMDLLKDIKS